MSAARWTTELLDSRLTRAYAALERAVLTCTTAEQFALWQTAQRAYLHATYHCQPDDPRWRTTIEALDTCERALRDLEHTMGVSQTMEDERP